MDRNDGTLVDSTVAEEEEEDQEEDSSRINNIGVLAL